jgi:hypothetical protein
MSQRLSKSRYTAGLQCLKQLWWRVHEPDAPELVADEGLQAIFTRGQKVGELARAQIPGGVLIDLPHYDFEGKVAATAKALADGVPAIFEASFLEDGVFVAVDILERRGDGFVVSEVKSTLDAKVQHLPDVAIQVHVVNSAGFPVKRAEVMHLNRECCYPDLSNLFVREDVTTLIRPALQDVPKEIVALTAAISGPLPDVVAGPHCKEPYACPFLDRCWPEFPAHHISTLYRLRAKKATALETEGIRTLFDLPADFTASDVALRQIRSVKAKAAIVEPGLADALRELAPPVAYLDFETINPAIPVWTGCHPYELVPVQFSCHVQGAHGVEHHEWIRSPWLSFTNGCDPSRGFQMRPYHFLSRGRRVACNGRRSNFLPHALHCFCGLRSPTMQPPTTISLFRATIPPCSPSAREVEGSDPSILVRITGERRATVGIGVKRLPLPARAALPRPTS